MVDMGGQGENNNKPLNFINSIDPEILLHPFIICRREQEEEEEIIFDNPHVAHCSV